MVGEEIMVADPRTNAQLAVELLLHASFFEDLERLELLGLFLSY